jgi:hypothetical protein
MAELIKHVSAVMTIDAECGVANPGTWAWRSLAVGALGYLLVGRLRPDLTDAAPNSVIIGVGYLFAFAKDEGLPYPRIWI